MQVARPFRILFALIGAIGWLLAPLLRFAPVRCVLFKQNMARGERVSPAERERQGKRRALDKTYKALERAQKYAGGRRTAGNPLGAAAPGECCCVSGRIPG
ncbi:MAG: hypothetical protein CMN28_01415 [Salinisphaeraceae bacterium]|nr:hypothetical protein [Salinisphaeraceae bacterium]